jgi:hypothetical protein
MQAALAGRDGTRIGHWAAWTVMAATLTELLRAPAWSRCLCRTSRRRFFRPKLPPLWRASDALPRLRQLLGVLPDGSPLAAFLPQLGTEEPDSALRACAALASMLTASLELARDGVLALDQNAAWTPVRVRRHVAEPETSCVSSWRSTDASWPLPGRLSMHVDVQQ